MTWCLIQELNLDLGNVFNIKKDRESVMNMKLKRIETTTPR
jgi:hypothetical protein